MQQLMKSKYAQKFCSCFLARRSDPENYMVKAKMREISTQTPGRVRVLETAVNEESDNVSLRSNPVLEDLELGKKDI